MEERKNFLDYLAQTVLIFGVTLLVIAAFCCLVGEDAKEHSTMFALGSKGIPIGTVLQYLLSSACITLLRFLFFSDTVIKKMSIAKRTAAMLLSVIASIGAFAYLFGWFPVDELECWVLFLACFGICFVVSVSVSTWKEAMDNRRLAEGLKHLKEGQNGNTGRSK